MFRKILIANRGEIAVRILRACRELGIAAVAVYSEADRAALHVRLADEAYPIGPAPSRESYLVIERIVAAARAAGCDAIHPGYGFLAENAAFARACSRAEITFIGPSPAAMEKLGSKTAARHVAREIGAPTVPGTLDPLRDADAALVAAKQIRFPLVLKAVAGGGGKGMRLVESEADLPAAWRDATSEAQNAFGEGRLYIEKYLLRPRHIEIQILGDHHGHIVYLGERECSVQRRYQKVIEEAPSPVMTPELRRAMGEAAVKLARAGGYTNAGTVEFLVDAERNFYFLEMNTRLQVEHPVTEMVTGLDLVKLQIRVAAGEPLPFRQEDIELRGHAIECRLYAEDPDNNFFPSPGKILERRTPTGPGIRLDDGVYAGWTVPNEYDPLLSKLIVWGSDRAEAIARLERALGEHYATGIKTNVGLFRRILATRDFQDGEIYTRWLDDLLQRPAEPAPGARRLETSNSSRSPSAHAEEDAALLAAVLWHLAQDDAAGRAAPPESAPQSRWKLEGRRDQVDRAPTDR
ncbi:MAG TPA: acetyl-CoA carboxylase biotin carboxylase subunit [Candidatus Aquilonibacter sp.]|nr:acetyl-CoA carboxylase biotin carboxylase subunit [Candidatus Aquilonibacter sp.]